jgi:hypothetical protein
MALLKEITAVYSENHAKFINTPCGQNAELLAIKRVAHVIISGF